MCKKAPPISNNHLCDIIPMIPNYSSLENNFLPNVLLVQITFHFELTFLPINDSHLLTMKLNENTKKLAIKQ